MKWWKSRKEEIKRLDEEIERKSKVLHYLKADEGKWVKKCNEANSKYLAICADIEIKELDLGRVISQTKQVLEDWNERAELNYDTY